MSVWMSLSINKRKCSLVSTVSVICNFFSEGILYLWVIFRIIIFSEYFCILRKKVLLLSVDFIQMSIKFGIYYYEFENAFLSILISTPQKREIWNKSHNFCKYIWEINYFIYHSNNLLKFTFIQFILKLKELE